MSPEDLNFFKDNGYLVFDQFLNDDEVARFLDIFERQRRAFGRFWTGNGTTTATRRTSPRPCGATIPTRRSEGSTGFSTTPPGGIWSARPGATRSPWMKPSRYWPT